MVVIDHPTPNNCEDPIRNVTMIGGSPTHRKIDFSSTHKMLKKTQLFRKTGGFFNHRQKIFIRKRRIFLARFCCWGFDRSLDNGARRNSCFCNETAFKVTFWKQKSNIRSPFFEKIGRDRSRSIAQLSIDFRIKIETNRDRSAKIVPFLLYARNSYSLLEVNTESLTRRW